MPDTVQPRYPENIADVPPDTRKEAEIFGRFDFGSAQIESLRHPQQDYCKVSPPFEGQTYLVAMVADGVSSTASAAEASRSTVEWFVRELEKRAKKEEINKKVVENTIRPVNIFFVVRGR
jgi:serine/threonine protein phosphatase PrpC